MAMRQLRVESRLLNYECSITKSYQKKSNRRRNQVPQLGQQPIQSIPPLQVLSTEDEAVVDFLAETDLTKAQLLGLADIPKHLGSGRKQFVLGEPLMWPELLDVLPTRMRELHTWYMKAAADATIMIAA